MTCTEMDDLVTKIVEVCRRYGVMMNRAFMWHTITEYVEPRISLFDELEEIWDRCPEDIKDTEDCEYAKVIVTTCTQSSPTHMVGGYTCISTR